jgi:branched-chain amino acid transport system ATP-binding protein
MLVVNNIEVLYSEVILAIKGVSLKVEDGQCVVILGANGAGKSTTLKAISGALLSQDGRVSAGSINFDDQPLRGMPAEQVVRRGLVHVAEGRRVLQHMTVDQNLTVGGHLLRSRAELKRRKDEVFEAMPALKPLSNRLAGYLSGGEQQMLVIGRALMCQPRMMLIDEPSIGLAPKVIEQVYDALVHCKRENVSLLIVEQNANAALGIADYGYVLENGRVVLEGSAKQLADNEEVREFYLGVDATGQRKGFRDIKHYRRRKRWVG